MNTTTLATQHIEIAPAPATKKRGRHARVSPDHASIRVIAGGRQGGQTHPLHARASHTGMPANSTTHTHTGWKLQGLSYHLSARERTIAICAGIVFTLAALATLLL